MSNDIHIGGRAIVLVALLFIAAWMFRNPGHNRTAEGFPKKQDSGGFPQDKEGFPVLNFQATDPTMNAAIEKARATLPDFITALGEDNPSRELFGVKSKVEDRFGQAHVWIVDVTFEEDMFTGTLVNTPRHVRAVSAGQTLSVASHEISDWSFVEDGKLVGGYTMRVVWDRLSEDERRSVEEKLGFKID